VNPLPLTSEVFKRLATSGKLGDTNCGVVMKVYNLCRVSKTDISAVLMIKCSLDPHMIIELEDELNYGPCLCLSLCFCYISSVSFNVGWYEHTLVIRC
jgi:hypothetical protein